MMRAFLLLVLSGAAFAQSTTTVTDTVRQPGSNQLANCTLTISSTVTGTAANSTNYVPVVKQYSVVNGVLSIALVPNDAQSPAGTSYTVDWVCRQGPSSFREYWIVPTSATPVTLDQIRTPNPLTTPAAAYLSAKGDLLTHNGTGSVRQAVGTNGQLLFANSAQSTGLQWDSITATSPLSWDSTTHTIACATCGVGSVASVFGRAGAVTAQAGDYNTDLVIEGVTNKYFSNALARAAISGSDPIEYDSSTGIISAPTVITSSTVPSSGDLTGQFPNLSLVNSGVTSGQYGSATQVPQVIFDSQGRATSATEISITYPVTSVFGRTGVITAQSGDYDTDAVTEAGNLYYTDARVRAAISAAAPITFNSGTGQFGLSLSANGFISNISNELSLKACGDGEIPKYSTATSTWDCAADAGAAGTGISTLNTLTAASQNFAVGTSGTDFAINSSGSTHTFSIPDASATARGLLTSADWAIFSAKEAALTFSAPLSRSVNAISITQASTGTDGYLSSVDWNNFSSKAGTGSCPATQYAIQITTGGVVCQQIPYGQITGTPTLRYQTVQANAVSQTQRSNLNFSTQFSLSDSSANDRTTVDLAATISANTSGNSGTATALAASPTQCSGNNFSRGISANGNATCAQPASTNLSDVSTLEKTANKNAASGYAGLDSGSRIAKAQAPSTTVYTDAAATFGAFSYDFSGAAHTIPSKRGLTASKPANCTVGEQYFATDATAGQNVYLCTATDTWTQISGGSGGGGDVYLANHNTFTRGQIINGSQDEVQLDVNGNATQTNPIARFRKSDGTTILQINNDGSVDVGTGSGTWNLTNQAAPAGTPSAGTSDLWIDATDKVLNVKDDAGNRSVTVRPDAGASNQFLTGITSAGAITKAQPSVSNLSDTKTGSGSIVLATSPTLVTPTIGVATATSVNKVAITAPATSATLTIANSKTLTASNTLTLAGTDGTTLTFQGTDVYVGRTTTDTLTNKTLTTPTIASFTNATHNHQSAAGGGTLDAAAIAAGTLAVARGGTNLTAAADDNLMVGNGTTWQSKTLPSCAAPNVLHYNTTTNGFTCDPVSASQSFTSQTTVAISHSLASSNVNTVCFDGSNKMVEPDTVTNTDANTTTVTFATAQTGRCVVSF